MMLRPTKRIKDLNRIWDNVKIAEQKFQTEGDCNIEIKYELFDFKVFDGSKTICTNLQNFRDNARQILDNFVCFDDNALIRTLTEWQKMVDKIKNICRPPRRWIGGTSDLKKVDDVVRAIFEEIKEELRAKTGITGEFKIHGYKEQLVAGMNYFIKCSSAGKFVHVRVYEVHNPILNLFNPDLAISAQKRAYINHFRPLRQVRQQKFCSEIFLEYFY
jgi:hypothetical protein